MEAAKDALARSGMVVLDEIELDTGFPILFPVVGLQKNPALVTMGDGLDGHNPGERSFTHSDHLGRTCIVLILRDILRYTLRI